MNDIENTGELIMQIFSNDPIILMKWILVFCSTIFTFVIIIKFKIMDLFKIEEKKVKKAIDNKHVIDAKLVSSFINKENKSCRGEYEYEINGKKYKYNASFKGTYPRIILHLYYEDNPKKVFTDEDNKYNFFWGLWGLFGLIIYFSPYIVGLFVAWILGLAS